MCNESQFGYNVKIKKCVIVWENETPHPIYEQYASNKCASLKKSLCSIHPIFVATFYSWVHNNNIVV
jgi:hypothetical protein